MNDEINLGIVGLGKMGIAHMAILNTFEGASVRAVAEKQKLITKGIRSVLPAIALYDRYEEMLEKEPLDAVYITSPTSLHVQIAEACLARGLAIFVEKPLGLSGRESKHLVGLASEKQAVSMVGYCKHYVETFARARELLDGGALGKPVYLTSCMYVSQLFSRGSGWRYKKESSGGGVLNILATHLVDILVWFFGDISSVSCDMKSHYSSEVEDYAHAYFNFESGLAGSMDTSWSIRNYRLPEIRVEVQCENGMLAVTEDYVKYQTDSDGTHSTLYGQDLYSGVPIHVGGPEYAREDAHFLDCVRTRRRSDIDVAYGYRVQRVTDAMYESAESRTVVELSKLELKP